MGCFPYYVVFKGTRPGIYDNWDDCRIQVEGFGRCQFKWFKTKKEAENSYIFSERHWKRKLDACEQTPIEWVIDNCEESKSNNTNNIWQFRVSL